MNTLGSHPGAILFRLSIMVILIAILTAVFFSYLEDSEKEFERTSILQTKRVIDSSLAVVFASYAVGGRLNQLNDLHGANPFVFLEEFGILLPAYAGLLTTDPVNDTAPGWYYLAHRRVVVYRSRFIGGDSYFTVLLNYEDLNGSGSYEPNADRFRNLQFVEANID